MRPATLACSCIVIATAIGMTVANLSTPGSPGQPSRAETLFRTASLAFMGPTPRPQPTMPSASAIAPTPTGTALSLAPDRYGQFHAEMEVEGRRVPVLVDTGASWVALSDTTAAALGFFPTPADFTVQMNTANGVTLAAPIEIAELRVGPIVGHRVHAMVMQHGALTTPALLGMSFLTELSGFSMQDGRLVLRQ